MTQPAAFPEPIKLLREYRKRHDWCSILIIDGSEIDHRCSTCKACDLLLEEEPAWNSLGLDKELDLLNGNQFEQHMRILELERRIGEMEGTK